MNFKHGGDLQSYYDEFGESYPPPLDFSANISPLGVPSEILSAISSAFPLISQYPDPYCRNLRNFLGDHHKLPPNFFFCGNGAAEILYRLVFSVKPKKALLLAPSFSEYQACLDFVHCEIIFLFLKETNNFLLDSSILTKITGDLDIIFLCQPNNPTGSTISPELLQKIISLCDNLNVLCVLDECFCDFLTNSTHYSMVTRVTETKNLLILRAFTKLYALPGLRLGYCISSDSQLIQQLYSSGQPWGVSTLAQEAGIAALPLKEYVKNVQNYVKLENEFLTDNLSSFPITLFPSQVNFILFYTKIPHLEEFSKKNGILIRDCSNFPGLSSGFYRIAVRTRPENEKLITLFQKIFSEKEDYFEKER